MAGLPTPIKVGTRVEVCVWRIPSPTPETFREYQPLDGLTGVIELFTHDKKKARLCFDSRHKGKFGPYVPVSALKVVTEKS